MWVNNISVIKGIASRFVGFYPARSNTELRPCLSKSVSKAPASPSISRASMGGDRGFLISTEPVKGHFLSDV